MSTLNPYILEYDGKKTFAVLPYEEYIRLEQELCDYQDLKDLREAKANEHSAPSLTLSEVKEKLKL